MSKIVQIKLIVGDEEFLPKSGYSVSVEQSVGGHSSFRIAYPANATEGYGGSMMNNALALVGKKASIGINGPEMNFTGVITSVDFQNGNNAAGTIVLSGHGPAVLLANSVQCFSYEEGTSLSQVATDTANGHSKEHLKLSMGKGTDVRLPYTVQYNESDLSFLQRLCSRYGVWLYHNGTDFCIGRSGDKQINGTVGVDVTAFNLSTALREQGFSVKGQDWVNDTLLEAESSAFSPKSSHPYLDTIKGESDLVFGKKGNYDYNVGQHEYSGHGGIDTATKVNTLGRSAGMLAVSGTSEIANLRVGDTLTLEGLNFSDPKKRDPYGSYDIVKVVHRFDHSGHYRNDFEGVPEGAEHLPYSNGFVAPRAGAQRGWVFDNADPNGLGRVKVQFPWQRAKGTSTPWIKMATPYSGSDKGFYFIPEKEEEVLVGFEGDNPEKPFVLSAGYNSSATSGFADGDNNIKAIKTRSGHLIELNDTDGGEMITIKDKNENLFQIETASNNITIFSNSDINVNAENNITIRAKESIKLSAKNIELDAQEDLMTGAGKNISNSAGENHNIIAKNKNEIIEEEILINAKKLEETADEISINSTAKNLTLFSQKSVDIQSNEKVKLF